MESSQPAGLTPREISANETTDDMDTRTYAYSELISALMVTELGYQMLKADAKFVK